MSHEIDTMFSVRERPWHYAMTMDATEILPEYPATWDDARIAAGLMWEPTTRSVYGDPYTIENDAPLPELVDGSLVRELTDGTRLICPAIDGFQRIVRDDTGATIAVPKDSYQLIQHHQMGELLDAYTEQWRKAGASVQFETAGSLKGGALVWALVRLDEPYQVPGDDSVTYPYAALLNAHDGSAACRLMPTQVRIVCWNTFNAAAARGDQSGHQVIIRHTGNVGERVDEAKAALSTMRDEAHAWQAIAEELGNINVDDAFVATFLDEFIPVPEAASERTRENRTKSRAAFVRLYEQSPTMAGISGNGYGLVQAAGEWLDHIRPYRQRDTYLARTMLKPEPVKTNVINLVRELASAN